MSGNLDKIPWSIQTHTLWFVYVLQVPFTKDTYIRKSLIFSSSLYSNTFPSSFPLIHLTNYRFSTSDTFQVSYSCPLNKTWNPRSSFHLFLVLGFDTTRCLRRRNGTLPRPVLPRHQQLLTVGMDGPLGGPAALGRGLSTQMPPVAQRKENTVSWNYGHSTLSPFYIESTWRLV